MVGKKLRLSRFHYRNSNRGLIVPIDHGLTLGPIEGLGNVREIGGWIQHPAICGVVAHKGLAERLVAAGLLRGQGLMIHLNGMASFSTSADTKQRLTSLDSALRLGADAVSFQVNFDGKNDVENLQTMGGVVDEASAYGLPVLAMVYDKVKNDEKGKRVKRLRHLIRLSIELGCDAVKLAPPAEISEVEELVEGLHEDIEIYFAGGDLGSAETLFEQARAYVDLGAAGLCVGRNVFQRPDAQRVLTELRKILDRSAVRVTEFPLESLESVNVEAVYGH